MTIGVEPILYQNKEVACVYRKTIAVDGLRFFTTPDNPLQVGIHDQKKLLVLPTHSHNVPKPIVVTQIQEVLYVIAGRIRVTIISESNKLLAKKLLSAGDAILLKSQAHKVEFLRNSRVFEIKQGPYPGEAHAKHYLGQ